jgi:hypothetical protein
VLLYRGTFTEAGIGALARTRFGALERTRRTRCSRGIPTSSSTATSPSARRPSRNGLPNGSRLEGYVCRED